MRDEAQLNAHKEAQKIIIQAIQRTASDHSVESTVSVVNLDSDDMKGRIIGLRVEISGLLNPPPVLI